jgi:hypothetical protein
MATKKRIKKHEKTTDLLVSGSMPTSSISISLIKNIILKHHSKEISKNASISLSFFLLFPILPAMTIKTDRLSESIRIIATEEILTHSRDYDNTYGIISVLEVTISSDKSYADIMIHGQ